MPDASVIIDVVMRGVQKATQSLQDLGNKASGSLGSKLMTLGSRIRSTGQSLTIGLTTPIVGAGIAITKTFTQFDDTMAKIKGLVGASDAQLQEWRQGVLDMAGDVGIGPGKLAEGLYFVASAGLAANQVLPVLRASAKASAAGLGDVATIADATTSAMNAYAASNLTAEDAIGIMVRGVKAGKIETDELAGAINRVLPISAAMGVNFHEVVAAGAALSLMGADAQEGMTQIKGALVDLNSPSAAGAKALDSVGLSYEGLRKQLAEQGLLATLKTINDAFGGNVELMGDVFDNSRALTGILSLLGENGATVDKAFADVAQGGAKDLEAAFEAAHTPGFKLRQAMAELQVVLIELGAVVVPIIAEFAGPLVRALSTVAEWFGKLPKPVQTGILMFLLFLAVLGPILIFVGALIAAVGAIALVFSVSAAVVLGVIGGFLLLVAAITALVVAGIYLWKNWDQVKAKMLAVGERIGHFFTDVLPQLLRKGVEKAVAVLRELRDRAVGLLREMVDDVLDRAADFGREIKDKLRKAFAGLIDPVEEFGREVLATFKFYFNLYARVVSFYWQLYTTIFRFAFGVISAIVRVHFEVIRGLFLMYFQALSAIVRTAWVVITGIFRIAFAFLLPLVKAFLTVLVAVWRFAFEVLVSYLKVSWAVISAVFTIALAVIMGILRVFLALLRGDWGAAWDAIKDTFSTVWEEIKGVAEVVTSEVKRVVSDAWSTVLFVTKTAWDGIKDAILGALRTTKLTGLMIVKQLVNGFIGLLNAGVTGINGFIKGANAASGFLSKFVPGDLPTIDPIPPIPEVDVGGKVLKSGIALVHKGEVVLNPEQQAFLNRRQIHVEVNFNAPVTREDAPYIEDAVTSAMRRVIRRR